MKDKTILLIRKWFKSKTGIDLIHDHSLISLVNEIEALHIHDVIGQSEQLSCEHPDEAIIRDKPTDYCLACNRNI